MGGAHCFEGLQLFAIRIWFCDYWAFYRNSSVRSHSMSVRLKSEYGSGRFEIFFAFGPISLLGEALMSTYVASFLEDRALWGIKGKNGIQKSTGCESRAAGSQKSNKPTPAFSAPRGLHWTFLGPQEDLLFPEGLRISFSWPTNPLLGTSIFNWFTGYWVWDFFGIIFFYMVYCKHKMGQLALHIRSDISSCKENHIHYWPIIQSPSIYLF